jgi:hypothetical protein
MKRAGLSGDVGEWEVEERNVDFGGELQEKLKLYKENEGLGACFCLGNEELGRRSKD